MYTFKQLVNTPPKELFKNTTEMNSAYREVKAPSFENIASSCGFTLYRDNVFFRPGVALRQDGSKWLSGTGEYLGTNLTRFEDRYENNPVGFTRWLKLKANA